jgi:hypothetical protein
MAKRKGKNTRYQKLQAEKAALSAQPKNNKDSDPEQGQRLAEQYPGNNILKNVLLIWRDNAPRGFMTFVPVLTLFLLYSVIWFISHMLMLIPALSDNMLEFIKGIVFINRLILMFGLPFMLTVLHLIYNWKTQKYYYFNSVLYVLPACILYAVLEFLSKLIPVLFYKGMGETIKTYVSDSLILLLVSVIVVFCLGALAQMILSFRKNHEMSKQEKAEKADSEQEPKKKKK